MPLDFPSSPNLNDTYTSGSRTWTWNGTAWGITSSGIVGPAGDWSTAQTIKTISTTTYSILSSDAGKILRFTASSAVTVTVPLYLGWTIGQRVDIAQFGTGQVTLVGESGGSTDVGINSTPTLKTRAQYSGASLVYYTEEGYWLLGDLAAA
jgi:hypothetical protein